LGIDFHLIDGGALPYQPESLDAVMMFDVIEHLHDSPRELLLGLLGLLKPSGCLMLTVPNAVNLRKRIHVAFGRTNYPPFEDYYWYPEHYRGHIREYTKDDLLKLSRYLDLEVLKLCGCDHMLQKIPRPAQPLYLALTSVFAGWKDTWMLVARKPLDWSPNKTCTRVPYAWS
jgi:SAM-dependent methyltransferase